MRDPGAARVLHAKSSTQKWSPNSSRRLTVNVGKSTPVSKPGSIEAGRAYDIEVRGRQVTLYLDYLDGRE